MTDLVRVSGTRQVTPTGPSTISAPNGNIVLDSTSTIATGNLTVNDNLHVLNDARIDQKLIVSNITRADTEVVIKEDHTTNVNNPMGRAYNPLDVYDAPFGDLTAINYQKSLRKEASAYFPGGVGIEKDLNVGGFIYGRIANAITSTQISVTATNIDATFYPTFVRELDVEGTRLQADNTGTFSGLTYNPGKGTLSVEKIQITSTSSSTTTDTGALTVAGGVGIGGDLHVDDIYTKFVRSVYDKLVLAPAEQDPFVEIQGDIRVMGKKPIGTAPVVTNVLYVTSDGDDTNDGRAQDASRACRTIGGAMNSPYYQPGTQILVSAGHYLEDNPLRMKPYTSIRGSDIRTTFIEPINKTQDLFHMDSGCYLNYMTFLNGRSGLIEGSYAQGFNRGAYCTSFPPLEGDERIDVFQSPYVQNCTNQSGPWLKDGTMFVPNQTVQLPLAVGTGSWPANTTTIVVSVNTGTIEQGMYINPGQQNPGFFNARTLMLANKKFMQEQVVAYVDATFNSGSFVYDVGSCTRDVGLIVDSLALDLMQGSTSESVFAGLQYWSQTTSTIPGEETTATSAIAYLKGQARSTILSSGGTTTDADTSDELFDLVISIISNGTSGITDFIVANGIASVTTSTVNAFNAIVAAIPTYKTQVIQWITSTYPSFVYDTASCVRDVEYIVKSVAFDLLHGGNKQSVKSGVYYYGYSSVDTQVPNEIPQVTAAYNFIKSIIPNIVQSKLIANPQQTVISQVTTSTFASTLESDIIRNNIDLITSIIRNGPSVAPTKEPINLVSLTNSSIINAYNLLLANKNFIKAEVIAYIDSQFNYFDYSREYCYRDVGILIENIAYDAAFGGNQKSVESGLAYYDGVISKIAGEETQTISAIDYLNQMVQSVIVNNTWSNVLSVPISVAPTGTSSQVINDSLTGGAIASTSVKNLFNIVTDIISEGPSLTPAIYTSSGPDAAFISAEVLMQANKSFIQEDTVNYINKLVKQFPYNKMKCKRDTGIILDSISLDLVFPSDNKGQSTFAGLQYWSQSSYTGNIPSEINQTIDAFTYLKDLAAKIVLNITPVDDLVSRYQTVTLQDTSLESASSSEVAKLKSQFSTFLSILKNGNAGWADKIIPNGRIPSSLKGIQNAYALLRANRQYLIDEVIAYIETTNPGFNYGGAGNKDKCKRDIGYLIDSVAFDLLYSGNRQVIQSGLSYYGINAGSSIVYGQTTQTKAAFDRISAILPSIVTNVPVITSPGVTKKQVTSLPPATLFDAGELVHSINTITNIIMNGPGVASSLVPTVMTATSTASSFSAFDIIQRNKEFIIDEVVCYIDSTYNQSSFQYNEELCYRDVGLLIDAVSQDIVLGGNQKSIEAGNAYWNKGYSHVTGQLYTTTVAINYARDLALQAIANDPITPQTQTNAIQVINPFFQYGGDFMPQEAVARNFNIITDIINRGPAYAPPVYAGGGLFATTGLSADQVQIAPQVTSVSLIVETTNTYVVGLSTSTIGFGTNSTLYFGDITSIPLQNKDVPDLWDQRRLDPIGAMGGSLVDGAVISSRSPVQSFVYDAFTQLPQGGRGIHIKNDGYAQLVSVFTIFCSVGVEVESGGIASIVNSNANFGDICLLAKGYGKRKFSGTIFNPPYKAYPSSPGVDGLDQYYPAGYWPTNAKVEIFTPDINDRPHISLVMEVVPPEVVYDITGHAVPQINDQGFSGFLNASPSMARLTTGTITITDIDTTGIAIGNTLYIRDQNNSFTGTNGLLYADTGTVVTDLGYKSVTLNKALTSGGFDPDYGDANTGWFNLYFCGNAYYTVLSSEIADNPRVTGTNILSISNTTTDQVSMHVASLVYLNTLTTKVINNEEITSSVGNTSTQYINDLITSGSAAGSFISLRFDDMINIISAGDLPSAEGVVPERLRLKTGAVTPGAGDAKALIEANIEFLTEEVNAHLKSVIPIGYNYNESKCKRDVKIILQRLIYDLESGGRYNSVMVGLSYWSRNGTHHIVTLGENVRRNDLFPDGAVVNFYQRSYMSATGYVFEYVGAGTNYGALPQIGRADPVQGKETVQLDSGKVFFTSTDQNGDFRIGPGLVISQATGVLSGRTFTKSLFANMTPFILAIESGVI